MNPGFTTKESYKDTFSCIKWVLNYSSNFPSDELWSLSLRVLGKYFYNFVDYIKKCGSFYSNMVSVSMVQPQIFSQV